MRTLQEQYNLIKEGKADKLDFLKNAKYQFPNLFNAFTSYEDSVNVLKSKGLIAEGVGGVVTGGKEQDWVKIFKQNVLEEGSNPEENKEKIKQAVEYYNKHQSEGTEKVAEKFGIEEFDLRTALGLTPAKGLFEVKAEEKKTSKEVEDVQAHSFDYKDDKNIDNVYGQSFLHGFYTEMQDPKNEEKTTREVKAIVAKNLAKDRLYYTKDGMFGIKGLGYVEEAPGLGKPVEAKGPHKSSGYGTLREGQGVSTDKHKLQPANIARQIQDTVPDNYTDEDLAGAIDAYLTQAAVSTKVYDRDIKPNFDQWISDVKNELNDLQVAKNPGAGGAGDMLRASIKKTIREKLEEAKKKPSAGLTKKEKSTISKKAHAGKDIGKKGKGFEKVAKAAEKEYGSKEAGQKVAAAAMWKSQAKKKVSESQALKEEIFNLFKKKDKSGEINVKDNPLLTPARAERLVDILLLKIADDNTPMENRKYYIRQYEKLRNQMPELNLQDPKKDVDEASTDLYVSKTNNPSVPKIVDPDTDTENNPKFKTLYTKLQ
jgi:hypothetical protein